MRMKRASLVILFSMLLFSAYVYSQQQQKPAQQPAQQQLTAKSSLILGDELYAQKRYDQAIKEYLKVAYLYADAGLSEEALYKTGLSLFMQGGSGTFYAVEQWKKLLEKYPDGKWAGETKQKIKDANVITHTSLNGSEPPVVTLEDKVASRFEGWGEEFMGRSKQWVDKIGQDVYNEEELKKAFYWFDKVIAEYPKTVSAAKSQYYRGECYFKKPGQADFKSAVAEYQKVVDNYPDVFWANQALMKMADTYKDSFMDEKKAIESYKKLIERNGSDQNNYFVMYAKSRLELLGVK
jgi:TolA-binding protein